MELTPVIKDNDFNFNLLPKEEYSVHLTVWSFCSLNVVTNGKNFISSQLLLRLSSSHLQPEKKRTFSDREYRGHLDTFKRCGNSTWITSVGETFPPYLARQEIIKPPTRNVFNISGNSLHGVPLQAISKVYSKKTYLSINDIFFTNSSPVSLWCGDVEPVLVNQERRAGEFSQLSITLTGLLGRHFLFSWEIVKGDVEKYNHLHWKYSWDMLFPNAL